MNIAELFVNLGVKGSDKAVGALTGVKKGLGEIFDSSLAAKAALVGVVYGMERLMSNSAQAGTDLANFNSLTGLSAQALQQWQYAARQAGVSSEELTGSLKGVQNSMSNMLLGKGAPEGMAMLANKVGFDVKRARDSFYVMQQLQKFAQTVPADVGNQMIKSFGVSEGTIAAMRRNAFNPETMKKAPTYSDKEIGQLNKVDVAWSNLGNKIQMAMGHFTSRHGMQLVTDISKVTTEVIKMVDAFAKLAEQLKLFEGLGKVFQGWGMIFSGITDVAKGKVKGADLVEGTKDFFKGLKMNVEDGFSGSKNSNPLNVDPKVKPVGGPGASNDVSIEQNLIFQNDGSNAQQVADASKKAVRDAYRQMQAQTQGA